MNIPPREQLPRCWKGLQAMEFRLPKLFPNIAWTCPVKMRDILEYVDVEVPGGSMGGPDPGMEFKLRFIRTARVNERKYWLWGFVDERGLDSYVVVSVNDHGQELLSYDEGFGLTPEQWLVMDYYDDWDNPEFEEDEE